MKIINLLLALFLTLYAVELSEEEKIFIKNHPEIKVGIDVKWHTLDAIDKNGEHVGIASDYLKIITKESGIKFKLVTLSSFDNTLDAIKEKKIDMISGVVKTDARSKYLVFTTPYISIPYYSFSRKDDPRYFKMSDLNGKKVTILKGFMISDWIKENYPAIRVVETLTIYDGLQMVYRNKASAFINDYPSTQYVLENTFLPNMGVNAPITNLSHVQIQMGIRDDYVVLKKIIDKVNASLSENNVERLRKKWFSDSKMSMLNFSNKELNWLDEHKEIKFTVDPMWLPFEGYDEKTMQFFGISNEILRMLSDRTGIDLKLVVSNSWSDAKQKMKNAEVQLLPVVSSKTLLSEYANLSKPYLCIPYVLYGYGSGENIESLRSIKNKKVAITDDSAVVIKYLKKSYPDIEVLVVDKREDLIKKLISHEADYFITDSASASYIISNNNINNIIGFVKLDMDYEPRIALSKSLGDTGLAIINKTIDSFSEDEVQSAYNKWIFVKTSDSEDDNRVLYIALLIFSLILAVLFVRFKLLK
ncbi:MAG: transporter substrate-binding domain-containing protein [Campylobacterota bacterium]|nr:transporter substrate-binding domain-containing protein [Campylobacterota bacterium]